MTRALMVALSEKDADVIAAKVIAKAKAGDLNFIQFLADRLEGKAIARNENAGAGDFADLSDVDTEQLRKALKVVK